MLRKKLDFCTANTSACKYVVEQMKMCHCQRVIKAYLEWTHVSDISIKNENKNHICVCLFNFKNLFFEGNLRYLKVLVFWSFLPIFMICTSYKASVALLHQIDLCQQLLNSNDSFVFLTTYVLYIVFIYLCTPIFFTRICHLNLNVSTYQYHAKHLATTIQRGRKSYLQKRPYSHIYLCSTNINR